MTTYLSEPAKAIGAKGDVRSAWYTDVASYISLIKLLIAAIVGAGSHAFTYNASNQIQTDAWTLFGTTRTKTYTYTNGLLTAESDWV